MAKTAPDQEDHEEHVGPGRPAKDINVELLKRHAAIHCTMKELAYLHQCSVDTLERNFADVIKAEKANGQMSLRRAQMQSALGRPGKPAVYLRTSQTEKGEQFGDLVLDAKGKPILVSPYEEPVKPVPSLQIWLGKQILEQKDKIQLSPGEGCEFDEPED